MQVKKISELEQVIELFDGCCFPIVQNDETKRVLFKTIREMIASSDEMAAKLNEKANADAVPKHLSDLDNDCYFVNQTYVANAINGVKNYVDNAIAAAIGEVDSLVGNGVIE